MKFVFTVSSLFLLFLFHVRYLSRFFDWDSSVYALNIQRDRWVSVFYNPHHLGFESSGYLYWKFVLLLFPNADIMFSLRIRILMVSVLFLGVLIYFLYQRFQDFWSAYLLAFCVAFSQAFWFYSLHNDTPLIHSCLVATLFLSIVHFVRKGLTVWSLLFLFFLQLSTVYFHQSNAILVAMVPIGILFSSKFNQKEIHLGFQMRLIFFYGVLLAFAVGLSYYLVGFWILKRDLSSEGEKHFSFWMFLYAAIEKWGASPGEKNYFRFFFRGIGDAFVNYDGAKNVFRVDFSDGIWSGKKQSLPYNLNLTFWMGVLGIFILNLRLFFRKFSLEGTLFLFWLIPSILFYTWWEGYFFEFWVGTTIGFWIFFYYLWMSLPFGKFAQTQKALFQIVAVFLIFFYFSMNFTFSALPRSRGPILGFVEGFRESVEKLATERIYR